MGKETKARRVEVAAIDRRATVRGTLDEMKPEPLPQAFAAVLRLRLGASAMDVRLT